MSLARNTVLPMVAALIAALALGACGRGGSDNLEKGKAQFTQNCGSCHTLSRAGTQGQTGPNLDTAFRAALAAGESRDTVEGIVHRQILHPRKHSVMPAGLVKGQTAKDVAAYVAYAVNRPGQDEGALAQAGLAGAKTGEQIFTAAGCAGCHTLAKAGASGTTGPNLNDLAKVAGTLGQGSPEQYVRTSIEDPNAYVVKGFQPGVMPVFKGKLSDQQVQALVNYLLGK